MKQFLRAWLFSSVWERTEKIWNFSVGINRCRRGEIDVIFFSVKSVIERLEMRMTASRLPFRFCNQASVTVTFTTNNSILIGFFSFFLSFFFNLSDSFNKCDLMPIRSSLSDRIQSHCETLIFQFQFDLTEDVHFFLKFSFSQNT